MIMRKSYIALLPVLVLLLVFLCACGQQKNPEDPTPPSGGTTTSVPSGTDDPAVQKTASVEARWADEALGAYTAYDTFIVDTSDARSRVLFTTDSDVTDFRLLALELEDVAENGAMTFAARELYQQDSLTPERPLVVELTFYGDLPGYGIAFVDRSGAERCLTLELSGMDGSLLLCEADGEQRIIH